MAHPVCKTPSECLVFRRTLRRVKVAYNEVLFVFHLFVSSASPAEI